MHPTLRAIKYLFDKKHISSIEETIDSFFGNGISFPCLVALSFNIDVIPNINLHPKTVFHININNDLAYKYLLKNNAEIAKIDPKFYSRQDQIRLLSLILTKQCFKIDFENILVKCNKIVQPLEIRFKSKSDLMNINCLLSLLNALTNEKIQINTDNQEKDIDQKIVDIFQKANVPLIIDKSCLIPHNQYLFFIQIEIIFDIFAEKIEKIEQNYNNNENEEEKNDTNSKEEPNLLNSNEQTKEETNPLNSNKREKNDSNSKEETNPLNSNEKTKEESNLLNLNKQLNEENLKNLTCINETQDLKGEISDINDNSVDIQNNDNYFQINMKKKNKISSYKKNDRDILNEKVKDQVLLSAINESCKDANLHFDNFFETIENDNLPKYLLHIFKNDKQSQDEINKIIRSTNKYKTRINSILEFLRFKDLRFKSLLLDFDHSDFIESSAISLYSTILECFFLKTTKKKLVERCAAIIDEENDDYNILSDINSYTKLIKFVNTGKEQNHINFYDMLSDFDQFIINYMYKSARIDEKIPIIINHEFIRVIHYDEEIPIGAYCQIQIIFNYLDTKTKKYHINECFLKTLYMFKSVKIPEYDVLARSIKAKNISLIQQLRRIDSYSKINKKTKEIQVNETINANDEILEEPKKFKDRFIEHSNKKQNKKIGLSLFNHDSDDAQSFWNSINKSHIYNNGVLYNTAKEVIKNKFDDNPWNEWNLAFNKVKKKKKLSGDIISLSKKNEGKIPFYKLFYYDEKISKWEYDLSAYEKIKVDYFNNELNYFDKTPLVLFFNSNEDDSIYVCEKLINHDLPNFDEISGDQICILGFCVERSNLFSNYDSSYQGRSSNIILFLFLHVPKSKQNIPNIELIIFQIYSYLINIKCMIIFILNMNRLNQLDLQEELDRIHKHYVLKQYLIDKNSSSFDELLKEEEEEEFEEEEEKKNDSNYFLLRDEKDDLLFEFLEEFSLNPPKYIYLFNDEISEYKQSTFNKFMSKMTNKFHSNAECHFINIKDDNTYKNFLKSLIYLIDKYADKYRFVKIKKYFKFLPLFTFSTTYIRLRQQDDETMKDNLKKMINERFNILTKTKSKDESDDFYQFSIITNLLKEINSTYPLLDSDYNQQISLILSDLILEISKKSKETIYKELHLSSSDKLAYLSDIIKNELYWTKEQISSILNGHRKFLKDEYFSIIKKLFPPNLLSTIYKDNLPILNELIDNDSKNIYLMFDDFNKKLEKQKAIQKKMQNEANYTIRERENEREIKVRVEMSGDLEKQIEQDF